MLATEKRRTQQYDIDFVDLMNRVAQARRQAEARPMDYARLGGAAFSRAGEAQAALAGAGMQAEGRRLAGQDAMDAANKQAAQRKRAQAMALQSQAFTDALTGSNALVTEAMSRQPWFTDFTRSLYPGTERTA